MDFDEVLSRVGELGRYQKWMFVLVCFPATLPAAITIFSPIFVSDVPTHYCHPTITTEKATLLQRSLAGSVDYRNALNTLFIPRDADGSFSQCQQYDIDVNSVIDQVVTQNHRINSSVLDKFVTDNGWASVQCLHGWDYDTKAYPETLATKFDTVCGQEWLVSTAQSAFFVGGTVGSVVFGWVSDTWGRRPGLFLSTAMMVIGNLMEISPPNYWSYIFMRFIVGFAYASVYNNAFLIVAEMIGVSKRMLSSTVCHTSFSIGMMALAYVAHLLGHWQILKAVTAIPMLLLIGYYWVVPESPRWLVSQGRIDEAEIIVQKMAKVNGVPLPPNFLRNNLAKQIISPSAMEQAENKIGVSRLLQYPRVMMKIIVISLVWTIVGMVYQGMSFAVPYMPSETYITFFLSGLCEIPGILFAWATMQRFGRKSTMIGTLLLSGSFSVATAFVPKEMSWLAVLFPSLAKLTSSATFTIMYIFTGELFPTVLRGFAIGIGSMISQFGLVVTPYILFLGRIYGRSVPFVILGLLAVVAAILMLGLPETLNAPLPTTMEESENYSEYVMRSRECKKSQPAIA